MPEDFLTVAIAFLLFAVVVILIWLGVVRKVSSKMPSMTEPKEIEKARIEKGELEATPIAEAIEERVKEILKAEGNPLAFRLDFGTAQNGSLDVWIDDVHYHSIDEIREEPIRRAVKQAVEEFNR
jgi:hypothetical protein